MDHDRDHDRDHDWGHTGSQMLEQDASLLQMLLLPCLGAGTLRDTISQVSAEALMSTHFKARIQKIETFN